MLMNRLVCLIGPSLMVPAIALSIWGATDPEECVTVVVVASQGADPVVRCLSPCSAGCEGDYEICTVLGPAHTCVCTGSTPTVCCSPHVVVSGPYAGAIGQKGKCSNENGSCPTGDVCGLAWPLPVDYPRVYQAACHTAPG